MSVDSYTEEPMKVDNNFESESDIIIAENDNIKEDKNSKKSLLQKRANKMRERQLELSLKKIDDMIIEQMVAKNNKILIYFGTDDFNELKILEMPYFINMTKAYLGDEFSVKYVNGFSSSYIEIIWE